MMNVAKVYTPQPTLHSSFYVNKSFKKILIILLLYDSADTQKS